MRYEMFTKKIGSTKSVNLYENMRYIMFPYISMLRYIKYSD